MKNIHIIICLSSLITCLVLQAATGKAAPASAEQLRSQVEAALRAKDTNAFIALFNSQGISDKMKSMLAATASYNVKQEIAAVKLAQLPATFHPTNELNGIRYRPNVDIIGMIDVAFTKAGNSMQMPYGKSGDAFYLTGTVEENIPGRITKAKALNIMIMGTAGRGTFSGSYVFVQNGKEMKDVISERGTGFLGDYIKTCTVQKTADNPDSIQVIITEDGKKVFESEEITDKTPIVYSVGIKP